MNIRRWTTLAVLLLLVACAPGMNLQPLPDETRGGAYRLGPRTRSVSPSSTIRD